MMRQDHLQEGRLAERNAEQDESNDRSNPEPHMIEWIIGGISTILVVAMIGFTLYQAMTATDFGPDLHVTVKRIEALNKGYRVEFRAINSGDATAADVKVKGQLKKDNQIVESSEITIDYIPPNSERGGGVLFNHDPNLYQLQIEARGYQNP